MVYEIFTKNAIFRTNLNFKGLQLHEFLADLQDSCVKTQFKISGEGSLDQVSIQRIAIF